MPKAPLSVSSNFAGRSLYSNLWTYKNYFKLNLNYRVVVGQIHVPNLLSNHLSLVFLQQNSAATFVLLAHGSGS